MKINKEFAVRDIAGDYVLVPVGESALSFNGMLTTNEVGAFICEALKEDTGRDVLYARLCDEFDGDPAQIESDLNEFLDKLRELNLLSE